MDVVDIGQDGRGLWQSFRVVGQTEQSKLETGGDAFDTSILDQLDGGRSAGWISGHKIWKWRIWYVSKY